MGISVGEGKVTKIDIGEIESKKRYDNNIVAYGKLNKITFSKTGAEQTWTVPITGKYKLEVRGAEGGQLNGNGHTGGRGGYACGTVTLTAGTVIKIYVGGKGGHGNGADSGGFNGGGIGGNYSYRVTNNTGGGGGASDIRIGGNTLYDRLIVAGGGGGGNAGGAETEYAYGGGESGGMSRAGNQGGTQTSAGNGASFGNGASNGGSVGNKFGWAGGGGGWYGGGSATGTSDSWSNNFTAGGGSGFVWTGQEEVPVGYLVSEDYILSDTQNIAGNQEMPNPEGGTMTGNTGEGLVAINFPFFIPQYQKVTEPGVYYNEELGLISMSADGEHWVTIDDKNVGALSADIENEDSYGNYFQIGNIHGFKISDLGNCLCFTANTALSTVRLTKSGHPTEVNLETSTNGRTWTDYTIGTTIVLTNIGDKVYMRNKSETPTGFNVSSSNYYKFIMDGSISASGDINYLLCKYSTTTLSYYCFYNLFNGCTSLTTTPEFPATTLADGCYNMTFYGCTSLTTAPKLLATTLAKSCYSYMFSGCSNIKLSETQTGEYQTPYRIPSSGTGTTASSWNENMFQNTGGTFTGDPSINTTYYLNDGTSVVYNFEYDFRNGSLEGFQAAGGDSIYDTGTHTFDANGLGQTSSGNDRQFNVYVPMPDLSDASIIELESTGYYINGSWSNGKGLGLCASNGSSRGNGVSVWGNFNSNSGYQWQGFTVNGTAREAEEKNLSTGDYTFYFKIDLNSKTMTYTLTGPTGLTKNATLSNSDVDLIRGLNYAVFWIGRGYSNYNNERLKTVSITLTY